MFNLFRQDLAQLSRRDFLKLSGGALFALFGLPVGRSWANPAGQIRQPGLERPCLGRVLSQSSALLEQPSFSARQLRSLERDLVLPVTGITLGDEQPAHNRFWYELNGEGFMHAGLVQPVENRVNEVVTRVLKKGQPVQVTVPYTDAVWNFRDPSRVVFRLYYGSIFWLTAVNVDAQGQRWYYLSDDPTASLMYYAKAEHFHAFSEDELAPISPDVPLKDKRIEVRLADQLVVAYEYNQPVFMSRAATGAVFGDKIFTTPRGDYITNYKFPARHMTHNDNLDVNAHDLPGVPWVCFITANGIAFHGTYWHNDYGRPRSHGCINLNLDAAEWIYRWTQPTVPLDERAWLVRSATRVDVMN